MAEILSSPTRFQVLGVVFERGQFTKCASENSLRGGYPSHEFGKCRLRARESTDSSAVRRAVDGNRKRVPQLLLGNELHIVQRA